MCTCVVCSEMKYKQHHHGLNLPERFSFYLGSARKNLALQKQGVSLSYSIFFFLQFSLTVYIPLHIQGTTKPFNCTFQNPPPCSVANMPLVCLAVWLKMCETLR